MLDDHPDHQQVGDFRERENGGIEERDQEETRCAKRKSERLNPIDESAHTISA